MGRANPFVLTGILAVFVAIYGGLSVLAGGLYLDSHEGDTYHFIDIVGRSVAGDIPHLDFMTPLGFLSFWPVVAFVKSGFSIGVSTVYAQITVALILFPLVIYAGATRMSRGVAILFGVLTLGLVLALSFGGEGSGVAIAMHYNRWALSLIHI